MRVAESPHIVVFDQYQRYHFIQRVVDLVSRGQKKRILEVGGAFSSALPELLKGHDLTIVDTDPEAKNLDLRASGLQLPFGDEVFDIVVSTDVLEHLKPEQRASFLDELQRVSSDSLVLGFPHNTVLANQADQILYEFIKNVTGNAYPFLSEHLENGLPDATHVKAVLLEDLAEVLEFKNANLHSWLPLMMSYFSLENHPEFNETRRLLSEFFNEYFDHISHEPPAYRTFFVGFKHPIDSRLRQELEQSRENGKPKDAQTYAAASFVISMSFQNALTQYKNLTSEKLKRFEESLNATLARFAEEKRALSIKNDQLSSHNQELLMDREVLTKQRDQLEIEKTYLMTLKDELMIKKEELEGRTSFVEESLKQKEERLQQQEKELQEQLRKYEEQSGQVENLQQYLNLFLKHPFYRLFRFVRTLGKKTRMLLRWLIAPPHSRRERILILGTEGYRLWRTQGYGVPKIGFSAFVHRTMPKGAQRFLLPLAHLKALWFWVQCFFTRQGDERILAQMLKEAHKAFASGDLGTAEKIFSSCHKTFPNSEVSSLGLARILFARGEYFGAQKILYESLGWNPKSIDIQLQLGSLLLASGSFWDAEKLFKEMHETFPKRIEPLMNLADLAMGNADYSDAVAYYAKALEVSPGNLGAIVGMLGCSKYSPEAAAALQSLKQKNHTKDLARAILETAKENVPRKRPIVSIIIPVYNKVKYTKSCVELIRSHTKDPHELIVVDNGSTDGTEKFLKSLQGVKVIRNSQNLGFVEACNQGAEVATGKYVLFLNNDTLPEPGWLEAMVNTAEEDPRIGIVGAKLLYPNGNLQEAGSICFQDGTAWNFGKGDDDPNRPEYNYMRQTTYCSGACLLVRLDLFDQIRGFDRRYAPAYFEDTDLAFAVRRLGYKVVYQPEARVIHFEGVTGGTSIQTGFKRFQEINQSKFREKWKQELKAQPVLRADRVKKASHYGSGKPILVMDHYLPVFDRSSGEHRLLELLKLFRKNGHHVTFVARNGEYQRRYKTLLEQLGIETYATDPDRLIAWNYKTSATKIDFSRLLQQGEYSLALISRYQLAEIYLPIIRDFSPKTSIAVDTVDVHYLREQRKAALYGSPDLKKVADQVRLAEVSIYEKANALITVTGHDAAALQTELGGAKSIWILPNIHPMPEMTEPYSKRRDLLFIGNFVHPPNSDAILYFCGQIFPKIQRQLRDVRLYIVGANSLSLARSIENPNVTITGYVPSVSPFLDLCRISVAPLRYGAGMKGKIGQAMAHGLPVVTTSIGAEGLGIRNGEHAFIADEPEMFADAVIRLYNNESLWTEMSQEGKLLIERSFSPEAVQDTVTKMLASLC